MNKLICGDFNQIVVLKGVIKSPLVSKENENSESFGFTNGFRLQFCALHFSLKFYKDSNVQVTSDHFNEFTDNSTSVETNPDISPGTITKGCGFWILTAF